MPKPSRISEPPRGSAMTGEDAMSDPILVFHYAEEHTRTPEKTCFYTAWTTVGGEHYVGRSRHGATCELARALVAAGIADAPMLVYGRLRGSMTIRSFHEWAKWTISEGRHGGPRRVRWQDPSEHFAERRNADRIPAAQITAAGSPLPIQRPKAAGTVISTSQPLHPPKTPLRAPPASTAPSIPQGSR